MRIALLAVIALTVASAAFAAGGPPVTVSTRVCGADRCVAADSATLIAEFGFRAPPAPPAPYFAIVTSYGDGRSVRTTYDYDVPAAGRVRFDGIWWTWPDDDPGALLAITAQLVPVGPPTPTYAAVARVVAPDPRTYLGLLSAGRLGGCRGPWLRVSIRSARPSPWTDGAMDIRLARRAPCLWIDGWPYRLPAHVAREARRGRPITG